VILVDHLDSHLHCLEPGAHGVRPQPVMGLRLELLAANDNVGLTV
jgi:hypothetical protein